METTSRLLVYFLAISPIVRVGVGICPVVGTEKREKQKKHAENEVTNMFT